MEIYESEPSIDLGAAFEVPERALEIGEQIAGVIGGLDDMGLPRAGWINRFFPTPEDDNGNRGISLQKDEYPGVGVIMSVAGASVTRTPEGLWTYQRHTVTSHSGEGAESSESIAVTDHGLVVRKHSKPGYSGRHRWRTENHSWHNAGDRPHINEALESFSSSLDRWNQEVKTYIGGYDARPRVEEKYPQTFRHNVIPFARESRS